MTERLTSQAEIIQLGGLPNLSIDRGHTMGLYTAGHIMKREELNRLEFFLRSSASVGVVTVLCTNFLPAIAYANRITRDTYLGPLIQQHDTVRNLGPVETVALLPACMEELAEEETRIIGRLPIFTNLILRQNGEPSGGLSEQGRAVLGQILMAVDIREKVPEALAHH